MGWLAKAVVLTAGLGVVIATAPPSTLPPEPGQATAAEPRPSGEPPGGIAGAEARGVSRAASDEADPRVRAFVLAYRALIDSVTYHADDVVFHLRGRPIHFRDGRMIGEDRSRDAAVCDPIFYRYSLEPLREPPTASDEMPAYCTDVLETLWGSTEREVRRHGRSITFLDHKMFVNELAVGPLASVERDLRAAATRDAEVAAWMSGLDITYSFISRDIAGSASRSHHAWGLAVDLVPSSYDGRHVYWRWSRVFDREGWDRIPVEERWSPPATVVETFERHGFVWGGKWAHFDMIHFEYRPEIVLYNRLLSDEA
jgi:hypothetical protein